MIAFVFALPDESRNLVRALNGLAVSGAPAGPSSPHIAGFPRRPDIRGRLGSRDVLVVHTGMGMARACERMTRLTQEQPEIECVVSAGYAGGLDPGIPIGVPVLGENCSDPGLLAAAKTVLGERCLAGCLATSDAVLETCAAKTEFARQTGAIAVDMETAAVAEVCRGWGVPMLSVRVISDGVGEELAVPFSVCFDPETERPRPLALMGFLARRPWRIPAFAKFVGGINRARRDLTGILLELAAAGVFQIRPALTTQPRNF